MSEILTLEESIRKRPGMFMGSIHGKGIMNLLCEIMVDCMSMDSDHLPRFTITLHKTKTLLQIQNAHIEKLQEQLNNTSELSGLSILRVVARTLEIYSDKTLIFSKTNRDITHSLQTGPVLLCIEWDETVFLDTNVDFFVFAEKLQQLSMLNSPVHIIIRDKRHKILNQNHYHFPQGIFYLFEHIKKEVLGTPKLSIRTTEEHNNIVYNIGVAYRTDWYPQPLIISFANNDNTSCGGSMVDGIQEGLFQGCKKYVKEKGLKTHVIKRKKFLNGLIIVCSIKGEDLCYAGSFKESLDMSHVKKQAQKIVTNLIYDFLHKTPTATQDFLWRFDETQLTHSMY